jgi:hypothetical protein
MTPPMTPADVARWENLVTNHFWSWLVWKDILITTGLVAVWLAFAYSLIHFLNPQVRLAYEQSGRPMRRGFLISGFIVTWLSGGFAVAALFNNATGYWLMALLSPGVATDVYLWMSKYLTLLGAIAHPEVIAWGFGIWLIAAAVGGFFRGLRRGLAA